MSEVPVALALIFFLLVALVPAALLSIAKRIWLAILIDSKFSTKLHGIGLSQIF